MSVETTQAILVGLILFCSHGAMYFFGKLTVHDEYLERFKDKP